MDMNTVVFIFPKMVEHRGVESTRSIRVRCTTVTFKLIQWIAITFMFVERVSTVRVMEERRLPGTVEAMEFTSIITHYGSTIKTRVI